MKFVRDSNGFLWPVVEQHTRGYLRLVPESSDDVERPPDACVCPKCVEAAEGAKQ